MSSRAALLVGFLVGVIGLGCVLEFIRRHGLDPPEPDSDPVR